MGRRRDVLFATGDSVMAILLYFPMVCCYWRGSWDLIEYYVLPESIPENYWVMSAIGTFKLVNYFLLPVLDRHLDRSKKVRFFLVSRAFFIWHAWLFMFFWRGYWALADHYGGTEWKESTITLVVVLVVLILCGCLRSTMWPPFFVTFDNTPGVLQAPLRLGFKPEFTIRGYTLYCLDCVVSAILILGTAIIAWRSIFNIMDRTIYPSKPLKADIVCAVFGFISASLLLALQRPLAQLSRKLENQYHWIYKYIFEDTVYVIIFLCNTSLWRGVWNLNARYFFAELPLGGWVNHGVGMVLMLLTQTYTFVAAFGVFRDGQLTDGGAFYPIQYLDYIFQKQKSNTLPKVLPDDAAGLDNDGYISDNGGPRRVVQSDVSTNAPGISVVSGHDVFPVGTYSQAGTDNTAYILERF